RSARAGPGRLHTSPETTTGRPATTGAGMAVPGADREEGAARAPPPRTTTSSARSPSDAERTTASRVSRRAESERLTMARERRSNSKSAAADRRRPQKKKISILNTEQVEWIDYKDVNLLRRFMSERAKIRARRVTGNS